VTGPALPEHEAHRVAAAADALEREFGAAPVTALVLGSGLKGFAGRLSETAEVPFDAVPHWPVPRVQGHGGAAVRGLLDGTPVVCLTGRVHLYEGWSSAEVVRVVRSVRRFGASTFVLTNAAGGIDTAFSPGDLMVLTDHLNLTGQSPLVGPDHPALGPRFPDQSAVYPRALRQRLHAVDGKLREGVYAGLLGPSYETPAEIRMLRALGAHAVGMSTVHEAIALNAMGAEVAGVSLISNAAAGVTDQPLDHDEVVAAGRLAADRFADLLAGFVAAGRDHPPGAEKG